MTNWGNEARVHSGALGGHWVGTGLPPRTNEHKSALLVAEQPVVGSDVLGNLGRISGR